VKLSVRRAVRQTLLDVPYGASVVIVVTLLGVAALGLYTEVNSVSLLEPLGFLRFLFVRDEAEADICPTCRAKVSAFDDRYCVTYGERLDELPAAPPIDDRVENVSRPTINRCLPKLERAGLVKRYEDPQGYTEITDRGRDYLLDDPDADDLEDIGNK
jgi:hypothetical protein